MCGIAGIFSFEDSKPDPRRLARMARALAHRGPDGEGLLELPGVALAHRRLAILDPSERAAQPMRDAESGSALVLNGEIYNFESLRRELESEGARFRSTGDAEVLLCGLVRHGKRFLSRLDGDFAFAFWDAPARQLVLARDRFGIKPLYFARDGRELVFASELRALFAGGVRREPDFAALAEFLAFRYAKGDHTPFRGIQRLRPGHLLVLSGQGCTEERYWRLEPSAGRAGSLEDGLEELAALFREAVRLRLRADVPVGLLLSAGVDSATIATAAREATNGPLAAFTYSVPGPLSEAAPAARLALELGLEHHVVAHRPEQLAALPDVVRALEEPIGDSIILPTFELFRAASAEVKVVLSGEGADELFGGYAHQGVLRRLFALRARGLGPLLGACAPLLRALPPSVLGRALSYPARLGAGVRDRAAALLSEPGAGPAHELATSLFTRAELEAYCAPELARALPPTARAADGLPGAGWEEVLRRDLGDWLPNYGLLRTDKLSMAHGLECRVPYLSHRVAELAFALVLGSGDSLLTRNKQALRAMARRYFSVSVSRRAKQPFFLASESAYDGRLEQLLDEKLGPAALARAGLLRAPAIATLRAAAGRDFLAYKKLTALLHLALWHELFLV